MTEKMTYWLAVLMIDGMIVAAGYYFHFEFVALSIVAFTMGNKLGWTLSKSFFYPAPPVLAILSLAMYGGTVALVVDAAIRAFMPGLIVRVIFGYGAGLYVSVPNYGLFNEDTIPPWAIAKHRAVEIVPVISYIVFSLLFVFRPW